jgi:DNA invertase Pin-like site-specific DNA recombinase
MGDQVPVGQLDQVPVGQLIGYARVSTAGQDLALQRDALERAGCDRILTTRGPDRSGIVLS